MSSLPARPRRARALPKPEPEAVLTRAVLRAAARLGMTSRALAAVLGVSEATVSRMRAGDYALQRQHKAFELGVLFVRFYRSLDSLLGGDDAVARAWLASRNTAFDASPLALIQTVPGLMNVIAYLDARRAVL